MSETKSFICLTPERIDTFLAHALSQTRSQIAQLIKQNCVYVDEKLTTKSGLKLRADQIIKVEFPEQKEQPAMKVDFDIDILYEDDDLLVISKPSGVTVHPAPSVKEATVVDWLKHKGIRLSTISGEERHGIVHRLDKGTSGAMVVAKTNEAHHELSLQLQDKSMGRYYLAVVTPPLKDDLTTVECPIARNPHNRLKMGCVAGGKDAKTVFQSLLLSQTQKEQLIVCKLFTGRTHQIRVHLESKNRHIIGDDLYSPQQKGDKSERILLHAYIIYFIHPKTKQRMTFHAKMDEKMDNYINKRFEKEKIDEIIDFHNIINGFDHSA